MQKLNCKNCGELVRVKGLAAICPKCGQMVAVDLADLSEIDPVAAEETKMPATRPLPEHFGAPPPDYKRYAIIGGVAALVVILVATVIIVVSTWVRSLGTQTAVAPPARTTPIPRAPQHPAESKGSEWFEGEGAGVEPQPQPEAPPPSVPASRPASRPADAHARLAGLRPQAPEQKPALTDEQIEASLKCGVEFLLSQFSNTRLKGADTSDPHRFAGLNALAVYALLHAGQSLGDPRLGARGDLVPGLLDRLKEYPMKGELATYSRSLRISALTVFNRPTDKSAIEADLQWLLKSSIGGAYTYGMPEEGATHETSRWDNSNSQYGVLGVWAASDAGFKAPTGYWTEVEQHWTGAQTESGGWGYWPGATAPMLSMTAAGATSLFVARDQLAGTSAEGSASSMALPLSKALTRALEWLDDGDNMLAIDGSHRGYTLYGIERAGLASGYKYFGTHDWYHELGGRIVSEQAQDGSWSGGDGTIEETSFALLFLARGRHPVLMTKLRFEGNWNNRPRDVAAFTRFASHHLERPLNWQVADMRRQWWEWSDSPVLLITSDRAVEMSNKDVEKLRAFAEAGGLIFTHAERGAEQFNGFAEELASRAFPGRALEPVSEEHEVWSIVYPMTTKPPLKAVSNGARLLMVHSPTDLSRQWQPFPGKTARPSSEIVLNLCIYASGRRDLRNRLASIYIPEPDTHAVGAVPLARLKYEGNWDPEPASWPRMSRLLQRQTGIALSISAVPIGELKYETAPLAHLTGTEALGLSEAEVDALRAYVARGGMLLIEACGGSRAFVKSVQTTLLPRLFPDLKMSPLPERHVLLVGAGEGMKKLGPAALRPAIPKDAALSMQAMSVGSGVIIFSPMDLSSGLLGTSTSGIVGYRSGYCQDFVQNLVMWTVQRIRERVAG